MKYPHITVQLTGQDSNAFMVLGLVRRALKKAQVPSEEIQQYLDEATQGDYDNLLWTTMKWVNVE